jgi:type III secretion protein W
MPKNLSFELLAKMFVKLISEKYPSPEKILKFSSLLGIADEISAQVIIFTQYRDAMRGVSPRLFKSEKHRQDFLMVLIETISELDDLLDEEEEEEENLKKKQGWNQEDTIE